MAWNVGGNNNQGGYQQGGYQQSYQQNNYQQPAGDEGRELDWGDKITVSEGSDYILLPPGDYNFTIAKFDRSRSQGSDKMPPCNMAIVYFNVHSDQGDVQVRENYLLSTKFLWKLSQLFCSVGLAKPGDELSMPWSSLPGRSGRLKLKHVNGTGEKANREYNAIDRLYTTQG